MTTLTITSSGTTTGSWGALTAAYEQRAAQSFKVTTGDFIVNNIKGYFCKFGAPVDSMKISIQADSAGSPSGTDIDSTYAVTSLSSNFTTNPTFTLMTFAFNSNIILTRNTLYWVVVDRTGTHVDTQLYQWYYNNTTNDYADGSLKFFYNSIWNNVNYDARLEINYQIAPPTNNIVAYYRMDGSSVDVVNALNGTDTTITYSAAKINSGASFNGTSSGISVADNNLLDILGDITISAWVNWTSGRTIVAHCLSAGASANPFDFGTDGTHLVFVRSDAGYDSQTSAAFTSISGGWHHVAVTHSPSLSQLKFYLDGVQVGTTITMTKVPTATTAAMTIGRRADGNYFGGMIDELGIWSRVLEPAEIAYIYKSGSGMSYPFNNVRLNALYHYKCDDGSGTTLTDTMGALNGTVTSASIWNATAKVGPYCINPNNLYTGTIGTVSTFNFIHQINANWTLNHWYYKSTALTGSCNTFGSGPGGDTNDIQSNVTNTSVYFHIGTSTAPYVGPIFQFNKTDVSATEGWMMLTITCNINSNPKYRAYLNGVEQYNANSGPGLAGVGNASNTLRVGNYASGGAYFMKERMDEITFWSRDLTATEVVGLYNTGLGLMYPWVIPEAGASGWVNKIFDVIPAKINDILASAISKVNGV
jgi:hypothetical protein